MNRFKKYFPVQYVNVDTGEILRAYELKNCTCKTLECNVTEKNVNGIIEVYTEKYVKIIATQLTIF